MGAVTVNGTLAPGNSPGTLHTGNLAFTGAGKLAVEIAGTNVADHDRVQVTGTVDLGGVGLEISFLGGFTAATGDSFIIIDNDGVDAVTGTFDGLAEGATFTRAGRAWSISYIGGDGNDVVLTVQPTPSSEPVSPAPTPPPQPSTDGNDVALLLPGQTYYDARPGDDYVAAGPSSTTIYGGPGADTLLGGAGDDIVRGGQGNDLVQGGDGNDWLAGDRGDDTIIGGAGADIFHSWGGAGLDLVLDFNAAEGDRVNLLPGTIYTVEQAEADTVISMDGGGRLVLQNVQLAALPEGWIYVG